MNVPVHFLLGTSLYALEITIVDTMGSLEGTYTSYRLGWSRTGCYSRVSNSPLQNDRLAGQPPPDARMTPMSDSCRKVSYSYTLLRSEQCQYYY